MTPATRSTLRVGLWLMAGLVLLWVVVSLVQGAIR